MSGQRFIPAHYGRLVAGMTVMSATLDHSSQATAMIEKVIQIAHTLAYRFREVVQFGRVP